MVNTNCERLIHLLCDTFAPWDTTNSSGSRDLDDTISLEDMSFERHYRERGSMTSVNSITTTCTTDSNISGSSLPLCGASHPHGGSSSASLPSSGLSSSLPPGGSSLAPNWVSG